MKKGLIVLYCLLGLFLISSVSAETYYVREDGNDRLDGKSDATAWKTLAKVKGYTFQLGDDVYFKCDGVWTATASTPRLYIDWSGVNENDRTVIGAYYGTGTIGVSGNKPIIKGDRSTIPPINQGLVQVPTTGSYVTIQDIEVRDSGYEGFFIQGDYITLDRVKSNWTYKRGVLLSRDADHCVLQNSEIAHAINTPTLTGAIFVTQGDYAVIRNNLIYDSPSGEFNLYRSDFAQVYDNVIYNVYVGMYVSHAQNAIVKRNLIYWTPDWQYGRRGITITDEATSGATHTSQGNIITDNLVANAYNGIKVSSEPSFSHGLVDSVIAHNIIVGSTQNSLNIRSDKTHTNSVIKNNIFYQTSGTIANVPNSVGLGLGYNLWSTLPESDAQGVGDVIGDPKLTKTTGWQSIVAGELQPNDFKPQQGSPAIDNGIPLDSQYNTDFLGITRPQGSAWDIGAFEYTSSCIENWQCTSWSTWSFCIGGWQTRTRTCTDQNNCGTEYNKPHEIETQSCGTGLIGHYTMDSTDISGTTLYDKSGNNNHGTIKGALIDQGKINEALNFDGVDDYVSVGSDSSLKPVSSVTACAWTKLSGDGDRDFPQIIGFDTRGYEIDYNEIDDKFNFWVYTTDWGTGAETISTFTETTEWIHVCGTYDGSSPKLYLNGVKQTDGVNTGNINYNSDLHVGGTELTGSYYNGTIDDVRIYNYALSDSEVLDLYNQAGSICGDSDTNGDSVVSIGELINYISEWKSGSVLIGELINGISEWKSGC